MNILSIGSDRKLFELESAVRMRVISYSAHVERIDTVVFTGTDKKYVGSELEAAPSVRFHPTYSLSRWLYPFDAILKGRKILLGSAASATDMKSWVITAQDPFESGLSAWILSRMFGVPFQLQIHTDFFTPYFRNSSFLNTLRSTIAGFILPEANRIRVVAESFKELLHVKFKIDTEKIDVLPVFVDIEKAKMVEPFDLKARFGQSKIVVLGVGRFAPEKNFSLAIRAYKSFHAFHTESILLLVGSGPLETQLREEARNLGVLESVIFEGWRDDVFAYYKGADIFLLTSNFEGYGMVLIEAAAAGRALVSTDVGIAKEFFGSQGAARVCPVGDAECLSKALLQLAGSAGTREEAGKKAQEIVFQKYTDTLDGYAEKQSVLWSKMLKKS